LTVAASRPRVAVLLSTYNGEAFLAAQLDSLLAQEGVDVDVFARDDGSTDGTVAILARYAAHWPGLASVTAGPNLGPAASFLAVLAGAPEGFDFYAFCDQDDVWLPAKLARAAERLGEVGPARPGLYCSSVMCVDEALRPIGERRIDGDANFQHLLFENVAFGNTVVLNAAARALIVARPPTRGAVMHDWWCALAVSAFGTIVQDRWAGVLYRQHRGNAVGSSTNRLAEFAGRLADLARNPRRFYRIHAQAEEFQRLWGADLPRTGRAMLAALVGSRRTLWRRLGFAALGPVVRGRWVDTVAVRVLIALGFY
jgi:glycosyltransferase involved in cell wall biosynthesis